MNIIESSHGNSTMSKQQNATTALPACCRAPDVDHGVHGHLLAHHLEEGGKAGPLRHTLHDGLHGRIARQLAQSEHQDLVQQLGQVVVACSQGTWHTCIFWGVTTFSDIMVAYISHCLSPSSVTWPALGAAVEGLHCVCK